MKRRSSYDVAAFRLLILSIVFDPILNNLKTRVYSYGWNSVRDQYEHYPYPPPSEDEISRWEKTNEPIDLPPVLQSPSHLIEMNHYLWQGRRDYCTKPFRILVAGGGTGVKTLQLARQLKDMRARDVEIVHLDVSQKSLDIARRRAISIGLGDRIQFVRGAIEDAKADALGGRFHYIDCLGVLHHMLDPVLGLKSLAALLTDDGGMSLMFYGKLGRTGLYPVQELLRMMRVSNDAEGIDFVRRFVSNGLPSSNLLRSDDWFFNEFNTSLHTSKPAQIVDVLMPFRDVAYRIDQVFRMIQRADLRVVELLQPAIYRPESYITDSETLARVPSGKIERALFAELLAGNIGHHFLYVSKKTPAVTVGTATLNNVRQSRHAIPVPHFFDGPSLASALDRWPIETLPWRHRNLRFAMPLPKMAPKILRLIDGRSTLLDIFRNVTNRPSASCEENEVKEFRAFLEGPFRVLFETLNGINKLYLTYAPNAPVQFRGNPGRHGGAPMNGYHFPRPCGADDGGGVGVDK